MKKKLIYGFAAALAVCLLSSCFTTKKVDNSQYLRVNSPEESGIVFTRITPENASVIASDSKVVNYLAINHTGDKLAYLSRADGNDNIYTLDLNNRNISQQRTYRNNVSGGFCFSPNDEELLFNAANDILAANASSGAICKQLTSGIWPVYSPDGKYIFFQRNDGKQNYLWRYNIADKELATLCAGAGITSSKDKGSIYFLRSVTRNNRTFFEIRKFNYENGRDEVLLSNENYNPSSVQESPDGKWLLFACNSWKDKKWSKIQLYVMRSDGTELTQLTFHPGTSLSPVWSKDGKTIYFVSGRGNETSKYGIWSMNFTL